MPLVGSGAAGCSIARGLQDQKQDAVGMGVGGSGGLEGAQEGWYGGAGGAAARMARYRRQGVCRPPLTSPVQIATSGTHHSHFRRVSRDGCQFPRRRARAGDGGTHVPGREKATVRSPLKKN